MIENYPNISPIWRYKCTYDCIWVQESTCMFKLVKCMYLAMSLIQCVESSFEPQYAWLYVNVCQQLIDSEKANMSYPWIVGSCSLFRPHCLL